MASSYLVVHQSSTLLLFLLLSGSEEGNGVVEVWRAAWSDWSFRTSDMKQVYPKRMANWGWCLRPQSGRRCLPLFIHTPTPLHPEFKKEEKNGIEQEVWRKESHELKHTPVHHCPPHLYSWSDPLAFLIKRTRGRMRTAMVRMAVDVLT